MKRIGVLSIALATAVTVGCHGNPRNDTAAGSPAVGTTGKPEATRGDKDFVHDVVIMNAAEIELGRTATTRATDPEVKKFAQMMVDDHTSAGDKLKALATQQSIELPAGLDDKHRDLSEKLAKKQGIEFDRDYMDAMVDDHKDLVDKLESRVDKANLAEWKAQMADRVAGKKVEERRQVISVLPEKSDNPVTMSVNQWAAEVYPVAQAHLESAKTLKDVLKKRTTN